MARRSASLRSLPPAGATTPAGPSAEAVAAELARQLEDAAAPTVEELKGTTALLDLLDGMGTTERARHGFRFRVVLAEGARAFLPDSDWGETVPTPAAIADRYGPGNYIVQVAARRTTRGGGWGPEIAVRIAPPRSADRPAPAVGGVDHRILDLFERLVVSRAEREDASDAPRRDVVTRSDLAELEARVRAALDAGDKGGLAELLQHPMAVELMRTLVPGSPATPPAADAGDPAP